MYLQHLFEYQTVLMVVPVRRKLLLQMHFSRADTRRHKYSRRPFFIFIRGRGFFSFYLVVVVVVAVVVVVVVAVVVVAVALPSSWYLSSSSLSARPVALLSAGSTHKNHGIGPKEGTASSRSGNKKDWFI